MKSRLSHVVDNVSCEKIRSPVSIMFESSKKYGLEQIIIRNLRNDSFENVNTWKKIVKQAIWELETIKWKATCLMYKELQIYRYSFEHISTHPWWLVAKKNPHLCKYISAVMGVLMGGQPSGIQIFDGILCKLCEDRRKDDSIHTLMKCKSLAHIRAVYFDRIKQVMPQAMWNNFILLSDENKVSFFINSAEL